MENGNQTDRETAPHQTPAKSNALAFVGVVLASLVIGGVAGYSIKASSTPYGMMPKDGRWEMSGGHRMPDGSMMAGEMNGMTARLETARKGPEFDKAFLEEMVIHHEGAVDMANLALQKSDRTELQDLSRAIIAAQTKEIDQMNSWLASWFK